MRQETHNTFNEGLNYDLNPITTPNNVLTDAVNGSFITFNGNELAIQNDAGNIILNIENANDNIPSYSPTVEYRIGDKVAVQTGGKTLRYYICVKDDDALGNGTIGVTPTDDGIYWREYIIRLTEGFFPIGVKEYGGVLYIVSRKRITDIAKQFVSNTPYPKGAIVYDELVPKHYWESLVGSNSNALPVTTDANWKDLGVDSDVLKLDEVEFGSFPSPERHGFDTGSDNTLLIKMIPWSQDTSENPPDVLPNILYTPQVLNNIIFRPGEYVQFLVSNTTLDAITLRDGIKKFYKLKLYQQLTSGLLDLTTDVEAAYERFLAANLGGPSYDLWILDPNFKYYCPFLYKGKLMIALEMEPMISFKTTSYPTLTFVDNKYSIKTTVEITYNTDAAAIKAQDVIVENNINCDVVTIPSIIGNTVTVNVEFNNILAEDTGKVFTFKITPYYEWTDLSNNAQSTIGDLDYLPRQFTEQYIITNSILLTNDVFGIDFPLSVAKQVSTANNNCGIGDDFGYRIYSELVLTNSVGNYIDVNLQPTDIPHVLIADSWSVPNTVPSPGTIKLGEYRIKSDGTIDGTMILFNAGEGGIITNEEIKTAIVNKLNGKLVRVEDASCQTVTLGVVMTANTNTVTRLTNTETWTTEDKVGNNITFNLIPGNPYLVVSWPENGLGYEKTFDSVALYDDQTFNYALVAAIVSKEGIQAGTKVIVWESPLNIGQVPVTIEYIDSITGTTKAVSGYFQDNTFCKTVFGIPTQYSFTNVSVFTVCRFLDDTNTITIPYKNITNPSEYVVYSDVIFRKITQIDKPLG